MFYTFSERTVLKHTVGDAIRLAEQQLGGRYKLCTNAVSEHTDRMAKILTVEKLSQLVEELVDDSLYYNVKF